MNAETHVLPRFTHERGIVVEIANLSIQAFLRQGGNIQHRCAGRNVVRKSRTRAHQGGVLSVGQERIVLAGLAPGEKPAELRVMRQVEAPPSGYAVIIGIWWKGELLSHESIPSNSRAGGGNTSHNSDRVGNTERILISQCPYVVLEQSETIIDAEPPLDS